MAGVEIRGFERVEPRAAGYDFLVYDQAEAVHLCLELQHLEA